MIDEGVADGVVHLPRPGCHRGSASRRSSTASRVAALVYRTITREQLRGWVAETVARELGIDQAADCS